MAAALDIGVFLLQYKNTARVTSFTRKQADSVMRVLADYLFDQSGGREAIRFRVFDWVELDLTPAAWAALGTNAWPTVAPMVEKSLRAKDPKVSLAPYSNTPLDSHVHILLVIDLPNNGGGTTPNQYTHMAARDFCPWLIAHELGHRYGAQDAFGITAGEESRYESRWCAMGGSNPGSRFWPETFSTKALTDAANPGLDMTGPGMCVPTLMSIGWLNPDEHGVGHTLIDSNSLYSASGVVVELSALAGSPGPGWASPPVLLRYGDVLVEEPGRPRQELRSRYSRSRAGRRRLGGGASQRLDSVWWR